MCIPYYQCCNYNIMKVKKSNLCIILHYDVAFSSLQPHQHQILYLPYQLLLVTVMDMKLHQHYTLCPSHQLLVVTVLNMELLQVLCRRNIQWPCILLPIQLPQSYSVPILSRHLLGLRQTTESPLQLKVGKFVHSKLLQYEANC